MSMGIRLGGALALAMLAACTSDEPKAIAQEGEAAQVDYGNYVVGRFAERVGDPQAADFLLAAAAEDPGNETILNRAMIALLMDGRVEQAADVAEDLRRLEADTGLTNLTLALRAFKRGDHEDARLYYRDVRGGGFEKLIGPVLAAWIFADEGDQAQAFSALAPLRAPPFKPFAAAHEAYLYDYFGDGKMAERSYLDVLQGARLSSLQPVSSYAAFLQRQGRQNDALNLLEEYTEAFPNNSFLARERESAMSGERLDPITREPTGAVSLVLFRAAGELGRDRANQPAIIYARLAAYLAPELGDARLRLAELLTGEERYEAALTVLKDLKPADPLFGAAQLQAAWVHKRAGAGDAAIAAVERYLERFPDDAEALSTLGDIYRDDERYGEAAEAYDKALAALEPDDAGRWILLFTRGISHERMGAWAKAEADLLAALERDPDNAQILNYLGYSWIDRGMHLERGKALIERAVALRPDDGFIIDSLGWAHYLTGDYDKAVTYLERAVRLEPSDPTINDHLGDAYWMAGRRSEARFQWSHALASDPEEDAAAAIAEKLDYGLELAEAAAEKGS